uniref:FBA_2 domain-containing protein n=1 Tax=Panagrellus redivivus TaxID=6233 RepID=A0A7E4VZW2_PANRE
MLAYILKHFATRITEKLYSLLCVVPGYWPIEVVRFSSKYHIQALMNVAGRFCTTIQRGQVPERQRFTDPMYDGLAFNDVLSPKCVSNNKKLFRAYIKGRESFQLDEHSISNYGNVYNCLKDVGGAIIRSIRVCATNPNEYTTFSCLTGLKIEDLSVYAREVTITRSPFLHSTPEMDYMKRLSIHAKLSIVTATLMLYRYDIDCVIMDRVRLINSRLPFDDLINQWRVRLEILSNAVFTRKGTKIVVRCIGSNTFKNVSLTTMVKKLNEALPDYEVECTHYIQCRYSKVIGSKSLEVKFDLYSPR